MNGSKNQARALAREISQDCIASRARLLNRVLTRIYDQALRPHGIKISQLGLLGAIELYGPIRPGRLGGLLEMDKSTVSRNVRILADKGWISVAHTGDGRERLLELTNDGRAKFVAAAPAWSTAQQEAGTFLGPDGGAVLDRLLTGSLTEDPD